MVFRQTLEFGFINFDDDVYVYDNPFLALGPTPAGIAWAFTSTQAGNWHPVTWLSFLVDYQLFGREPWGYHLGNVLLHVATAVALFLVLRHMTGDLWPSAFAAALFAVHPLRAESVAWISERKDVLSGLFFMLTLAAYVRYAQCTTAALGRAPCTGRYLAVMLLFALGLMAKPMLVTLPFVLLLLDYWPLQRAVQGGQSHFHNGQPLSKGNAFCAAKIGMVPWNRLLEKLPLFVLSAASCAITPLAQSAAYVKLDQLPLGVRLENAAVAYATYLVQFFYPAGLAAYYPHAEGDLPLWRVAAAAAVLIALTVGALAARRRHPWLLVGWLWYLGMLVPVIGIVQVGGQATADRYTYLPQIGLAIALTWEAKHWAAGKPVRVWACGIVATLAVAVLMGCAWRQTSYWRDSETLWRRTLDCTRRNALAHLHLGAELQRQGRAAEAVEEFQNALALAPDHPMTLNNLGLALLDLGQLDEAVAHLRRAVERNPRWPEARLNLGNALAAQKLWDRAAAEYQAALDVRPGYAKARYNLGVVLYESGRAKEALAQWEEMLRADPNDAAALTRTAWTLAAAPDDAIRNGAKAVESAQRAVRLTGGVDPVAVDALAAAYAESGRFPEALQAARLALQLAKEQHNASLAEAVAERIAGYESGRPARDPAGQ